MKLNSEELTIGAIFGAVLGIWIGYLAIVTSVACAILWALGGSVNKAYRRFGVPLVACGTVFTMNHHWQAFLAFPLMAAILSIGYGIPSIQPPDNGSELGRFWSKTLQDTGSKAAFYTRLTIYVLLSLCFIPFLF